MSAPTHNPSTREVALCEFEKALVGDKIINKCREVIPIKAQRELVGVEKKERAREES